MNMDVYSLKTDNTGTVQDRPTQPATRLQGSKRALPKPKPGFILQNKTTGKPPVHKPDFPKMQDIARRVGEQLRHAGIKIQFEVNKDAGKIVITILDPVSGEVIRKIPPEFYMKSVEYLNQMKSTFHIQGVEVDQKF